VSRRRARVRNDLAELARVIGSIHPLADNSLEAVRVSIATALERYLLPRLGEQRVPLVIAFIGSTGAGKSTLINSLAGRVVSKAGVLRPTTKRSTIWTNSAHRIVMEGWGEVVEDDHPLLDSVALVDTPDLDTNVAGHYQEAMAAAESADAVVFVTTAARYADALPWHVVAGLAGRFSMPIAVMLNRVPSRAGGARNDLRAKLRRIGLGHVQVLSVSEQRIDNRYGLSRPAVQRLSVLLRDWAAGAAGHRKRTFESVCDQVGADLAQLIEATRERQRLEASLVQALKARYDMVENQVEDLWLGVAAGRPRFWRRRDRNRLESLGSEVIAALDRAAEDLGELWAASGVGVPPEHWRASPETVSAIKRLTPADTASERSRIVTADHVRFLTLLAGDAPETVSRLEEGAETLVALSWPDD
jgi:energy-coupling factor transporter ATP-binding protein EcfA2